MGPFFSSYFELPTKFKHVVKSHFHLCTCVQFYGKAIFCSHMCMQLKISTLVVQVLKESFKLYCAINDGIINLVDLVWSFQYSKFSTNLKLSFTGNFFISILWLLSILMQFFDMSRYDALKAFNIYKRAGQQVFLYFKV